MDKILKLITQLREKISKRRMKLLRAEAFHRLDKVEKHEKKLIQMELQLRQLKDKKFKQDHQRI